ncbi:heterokaryon incompatibility protein-domain-containing protein [Pisolithus croceorrhizus]|nr:heterokaryon incompatibility protein-domain-containing protein [Pisolithus croceorrhizus]
MKLLDVEAVLDRDVNIQKADFDCVVLKELDDKGTRYAILSHRWGTEVGYEEMTGLMKMEGRNKSEVTQRDGYQKIIKSCEQAARDGYKWLWIDTCCIDKRSSSELSEAINSMYQWYRNAQVCYAYLHDVDESTFPTHRNNGKFGRSNGWPEWFVRGWTLQELIAPKEVVFFNKNWLPIGNKRRLAPTLQDITGVPFQVLRDGLAAKRLSVAQIMSWAAHRETTRIEDQTYSLLGLFGVNMPMLYGEGRKAFRRLQLEIIRESNDHSIFAWNPRVPRPGSVLAVSPSDFQDCKDIEKVELDEFADKLMEHIEKSKLEDSDNSVPKCGILRTITIRKKRRTHEHKLAELREAARSRQLGTFSVSNAGIQVWLPVIPCRDHFRAILACSDIFGHLVTIDLGSSGSSFDRIFGTTDILKTYPEFQTLYLTHLEASEAFREFALDDRTVSYYGFTRCGTFPREFSGNTISLSSLTNDLILIIYANDNVGSRFAVGLGYYFGQSWVHVTSDEHVQRNGWKDFARRVYNRMWNARAEHARSMPKYPEEGGYERRDNFIKHAHFPRSILAARVVWGRWETYNFKLMIDVEQCPGCCAGPWKWTATSNDRHGLDMPGLMKTAFHSHRLKVDGWWIWLDQCSGQRITLGDYGDYSDGNFRRDGNIYEDMGTLGIATTDSAYYPVVSSVSDSGYTLHRLTSQNGLEVIRYGGHKHPPLYQPKGLSLPANERFVLLLKALSTRLEGKHLVTTVIQSLDVQRVGAGNEGKQTERAPETSKYHPEPDILTSLYTLASPQVWRREPTCTHSKEQIRIIREHFYILLQMHQRPGTKGLQKSAVQ